MRSKLLRLVLICFCGLIGAQISSKIKLEKKHKYELYYTANKTSLLILDKTANTYYFRYISRGDVLTFITSKGRFQTNNATISLDTFQPDFNYRHYNYNEIQPDYYGNYITSLEKNNSMAIEIYFDKDLFFYNGYDVHPRIYTYENGQRSEISNFEIHQDEKNKKYYLSLEKEKFANSKISIIFNTDEFLLDLQKIGFTTFYVPTLAQPPRLCQNK